MHSLPTIIDVNASLGNWPFRMLKHNTPEGLLELMDAAGIAQAWIASFDAVLNREPKTANLALAEATAGHRDRLTPLAVVNPSLPTWDRDIDLYLNDLGMAGIRVYPNYHGYAADAPCLGELLACAGERGAPVEIAVRVADERMHHPLVKVPAVDVAKIETHLSNAGRTSIVFINLRANEFAAAAKLAQARPNVFVEISHAEQVGSVSRLLQQFPVEQVLFGSHAPLLYPTSAIFKLRESDLNDEQLAAIANGNARRIMPAARTASPPTAAAS